MKRTIAVVLLVGWLAGIATGLAYIALTTGWYEYYWAASAVEAKDTVNFQGWQPIPGHQNMLVLRRPRYRIGW